MRKPASLCVAVVAMLACTSREKAPEPGTVEAAPASKAAETKAAVAKSPEPEPPFARPLPKPPEEACAQGIVVAYKGATKAPESVKRDKAAALARADELFAKLKAGADFAALAKAESDAPSSAARGGTMGTHSKAKWPELHIELKAPVFKLAVGELHPEPIEAAYGYVLLSRCAVEKAHPRHILIRYKGAKSAGKEITRTKKQAAELAEKVQARLTKGEEFATLAREASEDSSADRGGDLGVIGRGMLTAPFESALFALKPGAHSGAVESEFGFHLIERMPDGEPSQEAPSSTPKPAPEAK